ncbi:DUF805 domain-containing protein [Desulfoluna butyratoxydans]|uniref:DUF805 domain-containing protein n=1 Tax=Desulfoluna butyratoxydans TaxID=231438 RepID=UPI003CCD0A7F
MNGRLSLVRYWLYWVIPFSVVLLSLYYFRGLGYSLGTGTIRVFNLLIIWPAIATSVKRLHDLNRSGWWFLLNLIPLIGNLFLGFLLCFIPGTKSGNSFE